MNELSWLLYAADVAGSLKAYAATGAFLSIVGAGASLAAVAIFGSIERFEAGWCDRLPKESIPAMQRASAARTKAAGLIKPLVIAGALFGLLSSFVPSRDTLYAIAASEIGERVITSETGGKAVEALNAWLDRQIAGPSE